MAYQLKYDARFAGARAVANKNGAQLTTGIWDGGTVYSCAAGDYAYCTGYYYDGGGAAIYPQTTDGMYLVATLSNPEWSFTEGAAKVKTYTQSEAQYLVNKIIKNNSIILRNNLLCARFANKLTESERSQVRSLQNRLQARNEALQAGSLTTDVHSSYPAGYAEMSAYLEKLMNGEQIGIAVSTIAWIVVACVVIAGVSTAAYYVYKSFAAESEQDVKFSQDLTRTLTSKLTDEEYQQLLDETKGIVTKARIRQALSSYGTAITVAAIAVAGWFGYKIIKNRLRQ